MPTKGLASALGVLRLWVLALEWLTRPNQMPTNKPLDNQTNVFRLSNVEGKQA
jgi:hypothetical protein